jgi:hypothetical protein
MIGTLLWLTAHDLRNRWVKRLQRLREPRYALAMIAGLVYFWVVFFRPGRPAPLAGATQGSAQLLYTVAIACIVASFWLFGEGKAPLNFSQAEVQLLFPAPITRRDLVLLKLLQAQIVIALSTVMWLVLLGGSARAMWLRGLSLWVLFATLHLHRVGASLVRASAEQHGAAGIRRHPGALVVVVAVTLLVGWSIASALPGLRAAAADGELLQALGALPRSQAIGIVLFPFRVVLAPSFVQAPGEWLRAMAPALLILLAHVPWVLRTDAAFEEAAADAAAARARQHTSARSRAVRVRTPKAGSVSTRLPLAPLGNPAHAIIWKNTIALVRTISPSSVLVFAVLAVAVLAVGYGIASDPRDVAEVSGLALLALVALLAIMGPRWIRSDLRLDMQQLELLRSFPLRGAALVRAEIASSVTTITVLQLVPLLLAAITIPLGEWSGDTSSGRAALLLAVVIALPAVNALGALIQNATALLFPSWVRMGLTRPGGVELMGQGIIVTLASLLGLLVLLIVPVLAGGAIAMIAMASTGFWGIVPGVFLGSTVVLAELWGITAWLGRVYERTEPAESDS